MMAQTEQRPLSQSDSSRSLRPDTFNEISVSSNSGEEALSLLK